MRYNETNHPRSDESLPTIPIYALNRQVVDTEPYSTQKIRIASCQSLHTLQLAFTKSKFALLSYAIFYAPQPARHASD